MFNRLESTLSVTEYLAAGIREQCGECRCGDIFKDVLRCSDVVEDCCISSNHLKRQSRPVFGFDNKYSIPYQLHRGQRFKRHVNLSVEPSRSCHRNLHFVPRKQSDGSCAKQHSRKTCFGKSPITAQDGICNNTLDNGSRMHKGWEQY